MTDTPARPELVAAFRDLHRPGRPLLMPNPWDVGSARVLAALGYRALATTSSGFAATLGRLDGTVTREQALRHAADIVAATELPVSADLENGFADEPEAVAELVRDAIGVGLAGCSIEDATGRPDDPIYEPRLAAERVAAAAEAAHRGTHRLVLTARAENHLHGRDDLADTIARCGCSATSCAPAPGRPARLDQLRRGVSGHSSTGYLPGRAEVRRRRAGKPLHHVEAVGDAGGKGDPGPFGDGTVPVGVGRERLQRHLLGPARPAPPGPVNGRGEDALASHLEVHSSWFRHRCD